MHQSIGKSRPCPARDRIDEQRERERERGRREGDGERGAANVSKAGTCNDEQQTIQIKTGVYL